MYLFLCVSVLCLMFLCVIPVLCLWALLPELKLMMIMILVYLTLINTSLGSSQAIQLAYVLVFLSEQ